MNSLLASIAEAERQAALPWDRHSKRMLRLLEWTRITRQIASFCLNRRAAERVRDQRPYLTLPAIELRWRLADELRPAGEAGRWPPLLDVSAVMALLEKPPPLQLQGPELLQVAAIAEGLGRFRGHLLKERQQWPLWSQAALELGTFSALVSAVGKALDRDGRLLDSASPVLARLRRDVAAAERNVRQEVERAMGEARRQGWTTASEVTLRQDRYCLPLRSGARHRVEGIIHDRSATGNTLFVEPASVVRLHNELVELRLALAAEETRILLVLNRLVEEAVPSLLEACRFLLLADQVRAGLLWSLQYRACRPRLVPGGQLRIVGGTHPLLLEGRSSEPADLSPAPGPVVPLDLVLPPRKKIILISGPNAGGKSVCLKTVGVLVLLAQCGWDIPADQSTELPLVGQLFVDLGDEQSIAKSLSSFSAHLGHLVDFLARADTSSLVLCDEIGSGTDPQEGTSLAFTVLERLAERGATVLASTHFGLLKAAVADHPAMINAAMDFDEQTLRPRFTLRMGAPGASHAFDIAERLGFPAALLQRARQLVGQERFQIERLLVELNRRARSLDAALAEARRSAAANQEQQQELAARLEDLARQEQQLRQEARQQAEALLERGHRLIEQSVREIRATGADRVIIRRARDGLRAFKADLPAAAAPARPPGKLEAGQRIRIPHLGLQGQIVQVRGERIIAEAAGMKLTLHRDAVEPNADDEGEDRQAATTGPDAAWRWREGPPEVTSEIDLRGQRSDEAWDQLDRLIDRAIPAGLLEIRVIHGIGTGRLRQQLHERLAADSRVRSWLEAPLDQGGHGVTIVRLAGE